MTKLLVSVRDAAEAEIVAQYPIGILDVKEPDRGALGAADAKTLLDVSNAVNCRFPLSFSAGELFDYTAQGNPSVGDPLQVRFGSAFKQYDFVKIGLAKMGAIPDWKLRWQKLFDTLPERISPVGVAYFDFRRCDAPSPDQVLELASKHPNCSTILFDTFHKSGNLFSHIESGKIKSLIKLARRTGLTTVIAGSISQSCLADVVALGPDYIGVRGAVCCQGRTDTITGRLVNEFLKAMQAPAKV